VGIGEAKDRLPHLARVDAFRLDPHSPRKGEYPVPRICIRKTGLLSSLTYCPHFRIFNTLQGGVLPLLFGRKCSRGVFPQLEAFYSLYRFTFDRLRFPAPRIERTNVPRRINGCFTGERITVNPETPRPCLSRGGGMGTVRSTRR
jgi:hypothetical protein